MLITRTKPNIVGFDESYFHTKMNFYVWIVFQPRFQLEKIISRFFSLKEKINKWMKISFVLKCCYVQRYCYFERMLFEKAIEIEDFITRVNKLLPVREIVEIESVYTRYYFWNKCAHPIKKFEQIIAYKSVLEPVWFSFCCLLKLY